MGSVSSSLVYGYLNSNGASGGFTRTVTSISDGNFGLIVYNGRILCNGEIDCFSDTRIKENILDVDCNDSLDIVRKLKPKIYNYIDITQNSKPKNYGFIAQEVDNIFPHAIIKKKEYIPNIYDFANIINKNTLKLNKKLTSDFTINDYGPIKIKLIFIDNTNKIVNLKEIIDDKTFTINENIEGHDVVFIYGNEVNDFHVLEKNAIFTITTSAVKQLDVELQETKNTVNMQQQEINELKHEINDIKNQINELIKLSLKK
jgi:hypothetical protein